MASTSASTATATPRRYRSSTTTSTSSPNPDSLRAMNGLLEGLTIDPTNNGFPDVAALVKGLRGVSDELTSQPIPARQHDFRQAGGFEQVLNLLRSFSGYYDPVKRSQTDMLALFKLLGKCLGVLAGALRSHAGNRRFFRYRVEGGGWEALEQIIASIGLGGAEPDPWVSCHVFGKLLAFSLDDEALDLLCQSITTTMRPDDDEESAEVDDEGAEQWDLLLARSADTIGPGVKEVVNDKTVFRFPEILRAVVSFWTALPRSAEVTASPGSLLVLETILGATTKSVYNCAAVHSTGVLSQFLRVAFASSSSLPYSEREKVILICKRLMFLGVNQPADTQFLLTAPGSEAQEFCLEMMSAYSGPPFFLFDLSLQGTSSLELPSLGRPFPPQNSAGYTFTAWIRVDAFDPESHTTIFGVYDPSQTCFVLMYLEKDTRNFILQTSVYSKQPSVRFKSVSFKEGQWYHIAIAHRRPKALGSSKAAIYVDGKMVEQLRCNYPQSPPAVKGRNEAFTSFNSAQNRLSPVQAFLGTPSALASKSGQGLVFSRWSLASAHLFEDVLSDDFIAVHHGLGPRYQGNFQDSLGGFQTYEASASLGLINETTHKGKEDKSDILKAVKEKASGLIPESKILLSILPYATIPENVQHLDTGLLRSLPLSTARNLFKAVNANGAALAINCAVPSLIAAIVKPQGMASFLGTPVVSNPSYLDENLWRLAGFSPLVLKLLEKSTTVEDTIRALEIMFHCIRKSWRNSEAMERDNGYNVLGMLLRFKLGYGISPLSNPPVSRLLISNEERDSLAFRILSLILDFIGYNHGNSDQSFIVNPLAYRILLIDLDIWRRSPPRLQELYYKQFVTFGKHSKFRDFNNRRLVRMRIVKRLLDAMKGEIVSEEVAPHFMNAFEFLVRSHLSNEVLKSLSLFIIYVFHSTPSSTSRTPRPASAVSRTSNPTSRRGTLDLPVSGATIPKYLSKKQLGIKVLVFYSNVLCEKGNSALIMKFAKTVTNKFLLHLLSSDDAQIAMHGCKILARILVSLGSSYVDNFANKSHGFSIMASRLKRFWDVPTVWPICFSILFGCDVVEFDFDWTFDASTLLKLFVKRKIVYPDVLPVITSMMEQGLKDVTRNSNDPDSPVKKPSESQTRPRSTSMDLATARATRLSFHGEAQRNAGSEGVLQIVLQFLKDLHARSPDFRDFALSSEWTRLLLWALYPVVVSADPIMPDIELHDRNSSLNFEGSDVIIRPIGGGSGPAPIVRTSSVEALTTPQSTPPRGTPLRRASSFVLLTAHNAHSPSTARLEPAATTPKQGLSPATEGAIWQGILDIVSCVFMDQIMTRKDFTGFGLFIKVPPGFQEHQAYFESFVLKSIIGRVMPIIQSNHKLICEPRILMNLSKLCVHLSEAIFEGWFMDGAETMIEFNGTLLEFLQRPDIASLKSVRLCSQALAVIRNCLLRVVLLKLSDLDSPQTTPEEAKVFMDKMAYWQMSILGCFTPEDDYLKLFWYQLYTKLVGDAPLVRTAAAGFLRIILVQKPEDSAALIRSCMLPDQRRISQDFQKLTEVDDETFVKWVDEHRPSLDVLFFGSMAKTWEDFVSTENHKTSETARSRLAKRREKLKEWQRDMKTLDHRLTVHEVAISKWTRQMYNSESMRYHRILQDLQDDQAFQMASYKRMDRDLRRPGAVFSESMPPKWKLDRTEGRNRMRLRLLPDHDAQVDIPNEKRAEARPPLLRVNTADLSSNGNGAETPTNGVGDNVMGLVPEEDYELVDDPMDTEEGFEDKYRKLLRRLEQGDKVQGVYNISRVTGLEACEGILIVGMDALYMMDNVFQCRNGDIVNTWQAPSDERDPFTQVVTAAKTMEKRQNGSGREQESRHWRWQDVISFSKRRFLFRDVAIEIFFTDGRSYLLTTINRSLRDQLFTTMLSKAPHTTAAHTLPNPEDAWRLEVLRVFDESPQGLGSRLGNIFNSSPWTPVMKKWQKGEMSNFHYLMMVNTMAGRTFNDLTQYPVFPWILADYKSEDLDLEDPATFRDLSKPMGAQTPNRIPAFTESYNALEEMGEVPRHYGTHYSTAATVSSYLIRLAPFVQSHLLLQGGKFDHADRLFKSIPEAWESSSFKHQSDVRELIPEFFCLPEFLTNMNAYDFGKRQSAGKVDDVELPPWAKGDPKIFIAKHREALESPYVSENLHNWIDLVFGYKQLGEAAVEALNVFSPWSYAGATDLDSVDAGDRAVQASSIHNFGQTPHQVFTKPHPQREHAKCPTRRLDSAVFALRCLPNPLLESHERVASLIYASKLDRLLSTSPFRLNLPPYDKYLEWGYGDNSIRFYFTDNRKPAGLMENLHIGQISCACFADSKTLITAGEDCVVSVYTVQTSSGKPVELIPRSSLFGHKTPVTTIAVSRSFSTFLTVSADGQAFLWDLNQLSFIRKLPLVRQVESAKINDVTGEILLCSGPKVQLYNLNGALILDQNVCTERDDFVHSCAFYEGAANEWLENGLIFTGHRKGRVNVWRKSLTAGKWTLELLRRLDHVDYKSESGANTEAGITCITPMPTRLYTGDDDGRVYEWNLVNRDR